MREIKFNETEMIVSMTDVKGIITYANDVFCRVAEYELDELIGQPHNIVRHPDMPKIVFKLLWKNNLAGNNFYGFVKNRTKNGNYYWVKAFFQPIMKNGKVDKLISYRRIVNDYTKEVMSSIYKQILEVEKIGGMRESEKFFNNFLNERNLTYMKFFDRLSEGKSVTNITALNIDYETYCNEHIIFIEHIKHQCELGNFDIKVTESCNCRFGKLIDSVKNEDFTLHPNWKKVLNAHNNVHNKLKEYVLSMKNSNYSLSNELSKDIKENTEEIFNNLKLVIDESR